MSLARKKTRGPMRDCHQDRTGTRVLDQRTSTNRPGSPKTSFTRMLEKEGFMDAPVRPLPQHYAHDAVQHDDLHGMRDDGDRHVLEGHP